MAINTVKATINGVEHTLTLNTATGKYEATITAPSTSSWSQTDHKYGVTLVASDTAGNSTTVDRTDPTLGSTLQLRVTESVKPTITPVSPTTGSTLTNNQPEISWNVTDDDSGVDVSTIKIKIDSGTATAAQSTTAITGGYLAKFTPTAALADGSHTITFTASDNDGNAADAVSITIKIDTVAPTLNVTSPVDNSITNNATCTVAGTTNDETSSPVTLTVNGTPTTVAADGTFSTTVTLSEGSNTITIVATDGAGKTTTVTRTVTLDTTAPTISAVTITPNPVSTSQTYTISVTVADT